MGCFAPHSHPSPPEEKAASRKKSRLRRKKTAPVGVGVGGCVGVGIEGRAQNIAPLQVGGIVAVVAIEAIEAIDAIDAIEDGLWGMWAWWDGGDKKVGFAEKKAASRRKSRLRRRKTAPVGVGVGGCVGVGIEGRAQNIAPLHLMRCLIVGYNL